MVRMMNGMLKIANKLLFINKIGNFFSYLILQNYDMTNKYKPMGKNSTKQLISAVFSSFIVPILLAVFVSISACKNNPKEEIKSTVNEVEQKSDKLSESEWEKYDKKIVEMEQQLKNNRQNFSEKEAQEINEQIGRYYALKAKAEIKHLQQAAEDWGDRLKGAYKSFTDDDSTKE